MKTPSYVRKEALLTVKEVDSLSQSLPLVKRVRLVAHVAVTNAVLKEMSRTAEKEREYLAEWLDAQGGVYAPVAKALREGKTPTLEQPAPRSDHRMMALEIKLREALTQAVQQRDALQIEVENLRSNTQNATPPKPWAVRQQDGSLDYYDTRSSARNAAKSSGGRVLHT
jgi:hypothetical protein